MKSQTTDNELLIELFIILILSVTACRYVYNRVYLWLIFRQLNFISWAFPYNASEADAIELSVYTFHAKGSTANRERKDTVGYDSKL